MKTSRFLLIFLGMMVISANAESVWAYYSPAMGRFISRDPLGYEAEERIGVVAGNSPKTGRFISRDPIGYVANDVSLYRYVGNQSPTSVDPTGLILVSLGCGEFPEVEAILHLANKKLDAPKCQKWFRDRGFKGPKWASPDKFVKCHGKCKPMCWFAPAWTAPLKSIGLCTNWLGDFDAGTWSLLMIHELAHHYCTIGPGREACANEGMEACNN